MSDKLEAYPGATLQLQLSDFNGKTLKKWKVGNDVPANSSIRFHQEDYATLATDPTRTFLLMTLKSKDGKELSKEIFYFNYPKDQNLPQANIRYKIKQEDGRCEVTLQSKQLARDVFIEIPYQGARFTDNFFDLLPGETRKITITSPQIRKNESVNLKIRHLTRIIH